MLLILSQTYDLKEYIPDRFTVEGVILAKGTGQVYKVRPPQSQALTGHYIIKESL